MAQAVQLESRIVRPNFAGPIRRVKSWGGLSVEVVTISENAPYDYHWEGRAHYVGLHDLQRTDGETWVEDLVSQQKDLRDTMTFIPSNIEAHGWAAPTGRTHKFTAVYLDPDFVCEDTLQSARRARLYFKDANIASTIKKLGNLVGSGAPDKPYAEALGLLLWLELGSLGRPHDLGGARGLPEATLSEIRDYIDANLQSDISLEELSRLARLSKFHFLRAFRRSTGLPPYRYLLLKRMERAQELLKTGGAAEEIALNVGFPNVDSFSRAFRRVTGVTPKQYGRSFARTYAK